MWKTDRLRGLTKNLSEFARDVVTSSYDDDDDGAAEGSPVAPADDAQRYEHYESIIRSLREANAAMQHKLNAANTHSHPQVSGSPLNDEADRHEMERLRDDLRAKTTELQAMTERYQQAARHAEEQRASSEAHLAELQSRVDNDWWSQREEFETHLARLRAAVPGRSPAPEASAEGPPDLESQVDAIIAAISQHITSADGVSSIPSSPVSKDDADTRAARQECDALRSRLADALRAQRESEAQRRTLETELRRLQTDQIAQRQEAERQAEALQQQHARDKALGHAELHRCVAELTEQRAKCLNLEEQTERFRQQLAGRRQFEDTEDRYQESQVIISRLTNQLREQSAAIATRAATHQQEVADLQQTVTKLQRQVAALQQERTDLQRASAGATQAVGALEEEREVFRESLAEKDAEIQSLQVELKEKEREIRTHLTEVDNLQGVLDMFRREKETEVKSRVAKCQREVETARAELREAKRALEAERTVQVELKEQHERALRGRQRQIDSLEEKARGLVQAMETQMKRMHDDNVIDKTLVNHLFLRYWHMRNDNNGIEVLQVMSKILNWDESMQRKVGLLRPGGFWSALLQPAANDDLPVTTPQDVALSDLWVHFLERQTAAAAPRPSLMEGISSDQCAQRPSSGGK